MNKIPEFVPRHVRLCLGRSEVKPLVFLSEKEEAVPVVGEIGSSFRSVKNVNTPSSETLGKYKVSDFDLQVLLENGVKLDLVNIQRSENFDLQELYAIGQKLVNLDEFAARVAEYRQNVLSSYNVVDNSDNLKTE